MAVDHTATAAPPEGQQGRPSIGPSPVWTPSSRPTALASGRWPSACGGPPGPSSSPSASSCWSGRSPCGSHWQPYILQPPTLAARQLWDLLGTSEFWQACWVTAQQAIIGYALVIVIGGIVGTAVARSPRAPGRDRLADHRHADHALGALVPAGLHGIRRAHLGHRPHDGAGGSPLGGQRVHQRHRPGPARPGPSRADPRGPGPGARTPRRAPGGAARRARRVETGVDLRLARPHGRGVPHPGELR